MSRPADDQLNPFLDPRVMDESAEDLYEQAPCGYCSCLPDGTVVKVNQTLLTWLGYAREELVAHRRLSQLLTRGGALHFELQGLPLLLLQGSVRELSYQLRRKDGTTQPVLLAATLTRAADQSPLVVRFMLVDSTDRRQYELELLRAKQLADEQRVQLAQANAALRENNALLTRSNADLESFIYTASHDLKAPITNIEGLLTLLRTELPAAVQQAPAIAPILTLMKTSVDRFTATIHQLTDLVRLQQAQLPPAQQVDLAALFADLCLDLAPQATAATAHLTLVANACPHLYLAPQHLRSILYNLLSNGIKYRHPDRAPVVQVRSIRVGAQAILTVRDNGLGLSDRQQGQLFGLFQRLHDHVEGVGIGLYTVKRLVENAGGTISVQSQLNVGSTFTVALPAEVG